MQLLAASLAILMILALAGALNAGRIGGALKGEPPRSPVNREVLAR